MADSSSSFEMVSMYDLTISTLMLMAPATYMQINPPWVLRPSMGK